MRSEPGDKALDHLLRWAAMIWGVPLALLHLVAIGGQFYLEPFWTAFSTVTDWYSPFNVMGFAVNVITALPAILPAVWLQARRRNRSGRAPHARM